MPQFFEAAVMTNAGAALLSRCIADEVAIVFTGVVVGDGSYTNQEKTVEALRQRTNLKSLQITYEPQSVIREDNSSVRVSSVITNVDSEGEAIVTSGFYINEIGLMAKPEDDATTPILFSVSVTSGTRGDYMPAYTGDNPAKIIQGFVTAISVDASVTLEEPTAPYALSEDLQDLADSIDSRLIAKADLVNGKVPSSQLPTMPDVSGKADKVSGATNGNFAGLDANGNLTDSGKKASDFATSAQISGKADKVSGATNGNFAGLDANGNLVDSGKKASDFATVAQVSAKAENLFIGRMGNDDRIFVIGLCKFTDTPTQEVDSVTYGTICLDRHSGISEPFYFNFVAREHYGADFAYLDILASNLQNDVTMTKTSQKEGVFRTCTFTYNGSKYFGILCYHNLKLLNNYFVGGSSDGFKPFLVDVCNGSNGTVYNQEIYDSIVYGASWIQYASENYVTVTQTEPTEGDALEPGHFIVVV